MLSVRVSYPLQRKCVGSEWFVTLYILTPGISVPRTDTISTNVGLGSSSEPAGDLMHNVIFEEIIETVSDKISPQSESPMTVNLEKWRSALVIFREAWASLCSYCGSQSLLPFVIAAAFLAVLILMQVRYIHSINWAAFKPYCLVLTKKFSFPLFV